MIMAENISLFTDFPTYLINYLFFAVIIVVPLYLVKRNPFFFSLSTNYLQDLIEKCGKKKFNIFNVVRRFKISRKIFFSLQIYMIDDISQ